LRSVFVFLGPVDLEVAVPVALKYELWTDDAGRNTTRLIKTEALRPPNEVNVNAKVCKREHKLGSFAQSAVVAPKATRQIALQTEWRGDCSSGFQAGICIRH
jgi:hypothetical protein